MQVNYAGSRSLSIIRNTNVILGSFRNSDGGNGPLPSNVAIGRLRIHDGCLTDDQVAYNYWADAGNYVPSRTPTGTGTNTPSITSSPSQTPSNSPTPTSSQQGSISNTPSASIPPSISSSSSVSPSPTATATASQAIRVGGKLWIELHAADFNEAAMTWDNRASFGPISG